MLRAALALVAGCSFIGVRAPSPVTASTDCSNPLPIFDGLAALAMTSLVVAGAAQTDNPNEMKGMLVVPLVAGLAFAVSGLYGYEKISACSDERDALAGGGSGAH